MPERGQARGGPGGRARAEAAAVAVARGQRADRVAGGGDEGGVMLASGLLIRGSGVQVPSGAPAGWPR